MPAEELKNSLCNNSTSSKIMPTKTTDPARAAVDIVDTVDVVIVETMFILPKKPDSRSILSNKIIVNNRLTVLPKPGFRLPHKINRRP